MQDIHRQFKIAEGDPAKTMGGAQSFEAVPQTSAIRSQYYSSGEHTFLAAITISPGIKLEPVFAEECKWT